MNDIAGEVLHLGRVDVFEAGVLPDVAVVVGELLDEAVANAVGPAIADVGEPGGLGPQHQGRASGAGAAKLVVLLAVGVDGGVGFEEGLAEAAERPRGRICCRCGE